MKILYVTAEDMNKTGGGKTHFIEIAQNLTRLGNEVRVVLPGYWPVDPCNYGLDVHHVPTFKKNSLSYLLYEFLNLFYMSYHILTFKPDAVYSRSGLFDVAAPIVASIFGVPYVIEKNGIMEDEFRNRGQSEAVIKALKLAERLNFALSDAVVCVTDGIKRELNRRYNVPDSKMYVVANGCNPDVFRPMDASKCRAEIGLCDSHFYVGFIGSFAPWQGLDTLVEAMRIVKDKGYGCIKCLLVGDGEMAEGLKALVKKHSLDNEIIFVGTIPYSDVPTYINSASVLVSVQSKSARNELIGLSPLKLYEYLACARPVIASRISGLTDIIKEGECGYLCEPGDPEGFAEQIITAYKDQGRLDEKGLKGRRLVEEKYSWLASARVVAAVISGVLKNG